MGKQSRPPALTIEARENQLISESIDEAERRIKSGKASDSLLIHYLRLGTTKMQLEKEKIASDVELKKAQVQAINEAASVKGLFEEAIQAMGIYTGHTQEDDSDY